MTHLWNLLAPHDSSGFLWLLALAATKATLLFAFAAQLCWAFRRFSAATRHLLWASTLCASLLLPFLSSIKMWEVPILPPQISVSDASDSKTLNGNDEAFEMPTARRTQDPSAFEASAKRSVFQADAEFHGPLPAPQTNEPQGRPAKDATSLLPQLANWALAIWAAGVLLLLLRLLVGFTATNSLARSAAEFEDAALTELFSSVRAEISLSRQVRLLRSEQTSMPIVCGILRPAVLLPAGAEAWPDERQRMVFLHELTHVTRRDCLTQMMAQLACAIYWFNPLVWAAARRLRVEREKACDDFVLSIGTKPSDYAQHLLEIARLMQERSLFQWSQAANVAMARRSQLEGRLLAILSEENKRGNVPRAATIGLVTLTCLLLLSLALIRPTVINAQGLQTSQAAANDGNGRSDSLMPNSFLANDPSRSRETIAQGTLTPGEAVRKQENASTAVDKISGTKAQVDPEADPFVNHEYQQERRPETRDDAGDFITEMATVGYANLSIEELIKLKTAGVTADYVRGLRVLGLTNLSVKDLSSMCVNDVTPAYIQAIRAAGYNDLSPKEITTFRIFDITPEDIKRLRDAGYGNLTAKQLIDFGAHEVTPAFIGSMRSVGYNNLSPKELVTLRVFDVTPEFVREARGRLGELTIKQIISLKNIGILDDVKDKEKDKDKNNDEDND